MPAADVMASTGLDRITQPELLQAAKVEFAKRTGGKKYLSLDAEPAPRGGRLEDSQKKRLTVSSIRSWNTLESRETCPDEENFVLTMKDGKIHKNTIPQIAGAGSETSAPGMSVLMKGRLVLSALRIP